MRMILGLSIFELKKYLSNKILILSCILISASIYIFPPYGSAVAKTQITLLYFFPMVMVIYFSRILSKEFENKTYKSLFTSGLTRFQVILYKILASLELSIVLMLFYQVLLLASNVIDKKVFSITLFIKGMAYSTVVFMLYGLIIASFAFLITSITGKFSVTFVVTYICFNDFFKTFLELAAEKSNNPVISKITQFTPFSITAYGFSIQYYSAWQMVWLLIWSVTLLMAAVLIIEKRDYR